MRDYDDNNKSGSDQTGWLSYFYNLVSPPTTATHSKHVDHFSQLDRTSSSYLFDLLVAEYNAAGANRFCYIRCLSEADRKAFMAEMVILLNEHVADFYVRERHVLTGSLHMTTWRTIMKTIKLSTTYTLWRPAYWGENGQREKTAEVNSRYHVCVEPFFSENNSPSEKGISLLYSKGHVEQLPDCLTYPALWANEKVSQKVWGQTSF